MADLVTSAFMIKVAKAVAITSSSTLSGLGLGISIFTMPRILALPHTEQLEHWQAMYDEGKATIPPLALLVAAIDLSLAFTLRRADDPTWINFAGAAALCVAVIPFTIVAIMPTVNALEQRRKTVQTGDAKSVDVQETKRLVELWTTLNTIRHTLTGAAGLLLVWTVMA